jgi:pantetheine-phosphate adenylyltransferase
MFPLEKRIAWCEAIYRDDPRISVETYEGLTVDFCRKIKASYLLRGIRFASDFDYEKSIATLNRALRPEIETIFLAPSPAYANLASTLVREVIRHGGDATAFLPKPVNDALYAHQRSS